jgi:hypothetical protein
MTNEQMATAISRLIAAVNATYNSDDAEGLPAELWNANEAAAKAYLEWRAAEPRCNGVNCIHCAGTGVQPQHYDEETGWSDDGISCETCAGTGRLTTVEQYLKTVPADWHQDSSVKTWFPILQEEVDRLRRAEASCLEQHVNRSEDAG